MKSSAKDDSMILPDGRTLAYAEYGIPDGKPLLFFHGTPGSRLEQHPDHNIAKALGIRMIVPERPGYGHSDPQPGRSFLQWTDDMEYFMDQLGLEHCAIAGFSGGGPYAMGCAHRMPERITRLGLISSIAPFDNPYGTEGMNAQSLALYGLAQADPDTFNAQIQALATSGDSVYQIMTAGLPEPDSQIFTNTDMETMYRENMIEAVHSGVAGIVSDMLLIPKKWEFRPEDIRCETSLWQGLADINVPPDMGKYLNQAIPDCSATFLPGEGHFLLFTHWKKILATVTA